MEIITKFELKQKVFCVDRVRVTYRKTPVRCEICDSTGEVQIKGKTFKCPECYGDYEDGELLEAYFPNPSSRQFTVEEICISMHDGENKIVYVCKCDNEEKLYNENRLFATYEKALAFVENANAEMSCGKHWSEFE